MVCGAVRVAQKTLVIDDEKFVAEPQEISNLLKGSLEGLRKSVIHWPRFHADAAKVPFSHPITL